MSSRYSDHDRQRRLVESAPADGDRGWALRDRNRLLNSAGLRRLADKTQSVEPDAAHRPHTRRTHSTSVALIGRRIAGALGADPTLVETAGLAHDVGHPPFGHNGERALDDLAQPCGGFEANAQTLRILTHLEPFGVEDNGTPRGLNLTRATLDATCKYPWTKRPTGRKFGAYPDDAATLTWIREPQTGPHLCIEAQIMDWADDIANAVHDLADAIRADAIPAAVLHDPGEGGELAALAADHFADDPATAAQTATVDLTTLLADSGLAVRAFDGSRRAAAAITRWTETTTTRLIAATVTATHAAHGRTRLTRHHGDLVVPAQAAAEVAVLRAVTLRYVLRDPDRRRRWEHQRELLADLAHNLTRYAPEALEPPFRQWWDAADDDTSRLRIIVDQIAALTEHDAVQRQRTLTAGAGTPSG